MSVVKAKQLEGVHADQLLDNLITAIVDPTVNDDIAIGYKPSSVWVNTLLDKVYICSDTTLGAAKWIEIKESSGASLTVTQAAHGYSLCEVLKFNGVNYVRGQANSLANVGIWLITKIIDANTFVISSNGYFTGLIGGVANTTNYLSSTVAGGLVAVSPAISQPIIYWVSATTGWILGYPASQATISPSSTPLGYNDMRIGFTGSSIDYSGLTNNGGGISLSGSILVAGAAGWRYLVVDTLGVVSVEAVPISEIIADTLQYTPMPVLDIPNNGYYSSLNPTNRILGIAYYDGTLFVEAISYGNGSRKRDDLYKGSMSPTSNPYATNTNDRFQYTDALEITRGTNFSVIDNGAGTTDASGFRITALNTGIITIEFDVFSTVSGLNNGNRCYCNKNGVQYYTVNDMSTNSSVTAIQLTKRVTLTAHVVANDYFTFWFELIGSFGFSSALLANLNITFEEF